MRRVFAILLLTTSAIPAASPADPPLFAPTRVGLPDQPMRASELVAALSASAAGATVTAAPELAARPVAAQKAEIPFWQALDIAADRLDARLVLLEGGRQVRLEPLGSRPREISVVIGPFRVVPRRVTATGFLDGSPPLYHIDLEVHWEPRLPVYRIDTRPVITRASDDRGNALTADRSTTWQYPGMAPRAELTVRLGGLSRQSRSVAELVGEFRLTAAERLLAVRFDQPGGKTPRTITAGQVGIMLRSFERAGAFWEAEVELLYPPGHPVFESFEEQRWLRDSRLRLIGPDGRPVEADSDDATVAGRRAVLTARFKTAADPTRAGWSLVCETPSPLVDTTVRFGLKDIPLP